jgi:7-carboxy-7-deazaguanine synthase
MSKKYAVVEVFPTLQGEGLWSGRRAVFFRLAGCNLWNGHPEDRAQGKGACARWCDTAFAKGHPQTIEQIMVRLEDAWDGAPGEKMVVITGGEPTLQIDEELVLAMKGAGWYVSIETNGTNENPALDLIDHVCVSPKKGTTVVLQKGHELKVVLPGAVPGEVGWSSGELKAFERGQWGHMFVQPQDITDQTAVEQTYLHSIRTGKLVTNEEQQLHMANVQACLSWVSQNPTWRLSLQTHKFLGLR